jgi:hypothetical protein
MLDSEFETKASRRKIIYPAASSLAPHIDGTLQALSTAAEH